MSTSKKTKSPASSEGTFAGFRDPSYKFFRDLDAKQDREWFMEHKAEYERDWVAPMTALLTELRASLVGSYKGFVLREPKVFRIQRDVRFSLDKSPYKTTIGAFVTIKGGRKDAESPSAIYLQLGTERFAGAGMYSLGGPELERYRAAVLDARKGPAIARMVAEVTVSGCGISAIETLKSAPRGVDKDHPRIELLRRKGLVTSFPEMPDGLVGTRDLFDWLRDRAIESAPIVRWLAQNVA